MSYTISSSCAEPAQDTGHAPPSEQQSVSASRAHSANGGICAATVLSSATSSAARSAGALIGDGGRRAAADDSPRGRLPR